MSLKGNPLKRALKTKDTYRLDGIPLIQDETKLITPTIAENMLKKNKNNRPINWNKVEQFKESMEKGKWKFHAQGIILDNKGNLLTGQKRLWAIIYSGRPQYMRISKGSPPETANLIDRGAPQTSRDLASRETDRKHSPTEGSLVRGMLAFKGTLRPSLDKITEGLVKNDAVLKNAMKNTRGIKKTKPILMMMAAICIFNKMSLFGRLEELAQKLEDNLAPIEAKNCWNRGAAFTLAMERAYRIVKNA